MLKNKTVPFFDYRRQLKPIKPLINQALDRVLNSGQLILGQEAKKFEQAFAKFLGVKHAVGVNSGTDALKISLAALNIRSGDEVITVANTAVPTISAMRELGALPKFVDIKDDFTIDEDKISRAVTKKTKAVIAVHLYGQPCNMKVILKIAKKYRLSVIEDCAQAHGANINGQKIGTFGDLACFSFYPTKNLGAYGDGGLIAANNSTLAQKCRRLRAYGMDKAYFSLIEGYNSRLDELQAAFLNVKLKYLNQANARRRQIASHYLKNITNPKIILPTVKKISEHCFHLFVIRTRQRNKLLRYLTHWQIGHGIHYPYPIFEQTAYRFLGIKKADLLKTAAAAREIVSLPIWPELTKAEINYVVNKLNQF